MEDEAKRELAAASKDASKEMKKALYEIPYLKQLVMGGELAKMAFDYMKANSPNNIKQDMSGAFNTKVKGEFKAFKAWISTACGGDSDVQTIVSDYEDYLALFPNNSSAERLNLKEFFDAMHAPGDMGNFADYSTIMNMMGMTGDRNHYVEIRQ